MRRLIALTFLLLAVGCQGSGGLATGNDGSSPSLPGATSASPLGGPGNVPPRILQTAVRPAGEGCSPPGALTPVSLPEGAYVPARVQTTTTWKQRYDLSLDYVPLRIPIPHLRIFPGPDQVITQTEYVRSTGPTVVPPPAPRVTPVTSPPALVAQPPATAPSLAAFKLSPDSGPRAEGPPAAPRPTPAPLEEPVFRVPAGPTERPETPRPAASAATGTAPLPPRFLPAPPPSPAAGDRPAGKAPPEELSPPPSPGIPSHLPPAENTQTLLPPIGR
jgi:hypothetical protein